MKNQTQQLNSEEVMTAQEVALRLKIPISTLYGLTKQGKIRAVKVGKHWRYLASEIDQYLRGTPVRVTFEIPEKRKHPRLNCELPATVTIMLDYAQGSEMGRIKNISEGGIRFVPDRSEQVIRAGDPVKVNVIDQKFWPNGIEVEGRVVHEAMMGHGAHGIKFKNMPEWLKGAIRDYVG